LNQDQFTTLRILENFQISINALIQDLKWLITIAPIPITFAIILISIIIFYFIKSSRSQKLSDNKQKTHKFESSDFEVQMSLDLIDTLVRMNEIEEAKKKYLSIKDRLTESQISSVSPKVIS
jgi:hypothetical protein